MVQATRLQRRFERFVMPEPNTGCWLWMGQTVKKGNYESARFGVSPAQRSEIASRVAWTLYRGGHIPTGMVVCHRCDVAVCVNPAHLFLGTQRDNLMDATRKGRARGKFTSLTGRAAGIKSAARKKDSVTRMYD